MRSLVAGDKRSARLIIHKDIRQQWTEGKKTGQGAYILSDEDWESASSRSSESGYDNIEALKCFVSLSVFVRVPGTVVRVKEGAKRNEEE
uniref:Uncharacterized protein n=1 Tax=Timema genevievae TaxID=629358 RepID=A0A7R9K6J1_TIMGE|nr:unnamed protein product [Timema genevievae]